MAEKWTHKHKYSMMHLLIECVGGMGNMHMVRNCELWTTRIWPLLRYVHAWTNFQSKLQPFQSTKHGGQPDSRRWQDISPLCCGWYILADVCAQNSSNSRSRQKLTKSKSLKAITFLNAILQKTAKCTTPNKQPASRRALKNRVMTVHPKIKAHKPIKYWYKDNNDDSVG